MQRIFPALIFTVILTWLAGALWCSPLMFRDVAKEGTHALLCVDYFCDSEGPVVKDGLWLYAERIHLNMAGSKYLASRSENVFRRFLTAGRERK